VRRKIAFRCQAFSPGFSSSIFNRRFFHHGLSASEPAPQIVMTNQMEVDLSRSPDHFPEE